MRRDRDPHLAAWKQELRTLMVELNRLHHPVYPGDPERIAELETQVAELREAIRGRTATLGGGAVTADG